MTIVGDGKFKYEVDRDWLLRGVPRYWNLAAIPDVAIDSEGLVWVFSRSEHPVSCWSPDGEFVGSWGDLGQQPGEFRVPHGIMIDGDDNIWLADHQTHQVTKHARDGSVLLELGKFGYANITVTTDGSQGSPFNMPTAAAIASDGKIFITDGYANKRVHRFSASGDLEHSWGEAGTGPGQFAILHKVAVDAQDRVWVCDRENDRIQIFDADGTYLEQWDDVVMPGDIFFAEDGTVYVLEQGEGNGMSIFTPDGELITRWRGNKDANDAAHGCTVDGDGNIYVAEIGDTPDGQRVTKFNRI